MQYDVAISFAGEQRAEARSIAKCLTENGLKVFFDEYEDALLWGEDLYERLSDIYQNQASYCITLVSKAYAEKIWTSHERKNAQARALKETKAYILPVRFDTTEIPGLPTTIGYLDFAKYGADGICNAFLRKLGRTASVVSRVVKPRIISRSNYAFIHPAESGQWLFVPVRKCRWSSKEISMSLEPDDPSDGPILNNIKIGARVFLGYEFEVAQCRLNDRTQISEGALRQWDISFQIEEFNFSPTLEINFAGVSANELAEKRARRILLNEDPATETRDINKSLIEHYTAGQGTVSIKRSMLPELFRQYGDNPQRFLAIAWTCAIALLKLSGAIAEILHLEFALEDESLKVAFHGKRKKEYVNQPPFEIRVTGKCSLK